MMGMRRSAAPCGTVVRGCGTHLGTHSRRSLRDPYLRAASTPPPRHHRPLPAEVCDARADRYVHRRSSVENVRRGVRELDEDPVWRPHQHPHDHVWAGHPRPECATSRGDCVRAVRPSYLAPARRWMNGLLADLERFLPLPLHPWSGRTHHGQSVRRRGDSQGGVQPAGGANRERAWSAATTDRGEQCEAASDNPWRGNRPGERSVSAHDYLAMLPLRVRRSPSNSARSRSSTNLRLAWSNCGASRTKDPRA